MRLPPRLVLLLLCNFVLLCDLSGCADKPAPKIINKTPPVIVKEKDPTDPKMDSRIELEITNLWAKKNADMSGALSVASQGGHVLIKGTVSDPEWRVTAAQLAWQVKGVQQVTSLVKIDSNAQNTDIDSWISSQLRAKLIKDKKIKSTNYTVDTIDGKIYLTGVAQNQNEMDRVVDMARTISGVKEVVNDLQLKGSI